jgi:hypothetical protein
VYTSYDYSAPLRETRQQWNKLFQTKLVNMFAASSPDLLKTVMVGNGTNYKTSTKDVFTWLLRNPDTGSTFSVFQQSKSSSRAKVSFSVTLETSIGPVTVPNVGLDGRQSRISTTDYKFGSNTLLFATADIATWGVFDVDVLIFYLKEGQTGHFALKGEQKLSYEAFGKSTVSSTLNGTHQVFVYQQGAGVSAVKLSNGVLVYLLDQATAWRLWTPKTTTHPLSKPDQQLFVIGPYLVRKASVEGSVLHIVGDNDIPASLEAYVGDHDISKVEWNGISLAAKKTRYGAIQASIPGAQDRNITLPSLQDAKWLSSDSLPEINPNFDDTGWISCNKTSTKSPTAPSSLPVLFSSDYGFYAGEKIYRGRFDGRGHTSVNITASGGLAFGWNAWLNGQLVGGDLGHQGLSTTSAVLKLPTDLLREKDNLLAVLVGYHGHDQTSTAKGVANPRGLLGAVLLPGGTPRATGFGGWKVQGNAGGGAAYLDPVRGPMNEGGLFAERMGWFLPGFSPSNSSAWTASSPLDGLSGAGVRFYRTTFRLGLDEDLDVPLGIELGATAGTAARVTLWVNGWQYGRYVPHIGPQTVFPIPPGVVNNRGENSLAVSVWAQTDSGAKLSTVRLIQYGAYQTGFNFNRDWRRLQPGWTDRSRFA